jgi:enoyl-CoA hydratase
MAYGNLLLSIEGKVATLTVNRPEVRNALDTATVDEMHRALGEVRGAGATVLIVTGAGDKAFVSGADIRAIRERRRDDALASINSRLMTALETHDAVVIAAWRRGPRGQRPRRSPRPAHHRHAVFGLPEPSLGIIPRAGGTQRACPRSSAGPGQGDDPDRRSLGRAELSTARRARWCRDPSPGGAHGERVLTLGAGGPPGR